MQTNRLNGIKSPFVGSRMSIPARNPIVMKSLSTFRGCFEEEEEAKVIVWNHPFNHNRFPPDKWRYFQPLITSSLRIYSLPNTFSHNLLLMTGSKIWLKFYRASTIKAWKRAKYEPQKLDWVILILEDVEKFFFFASFWRFIIIVDRIK